MGWRTKVKNRPQGMVYRYGMVKTRMGSQRSMHVWVNAMKNGQQSNRYWIHHEERASG